MADRKPPVCQGDCIRCALTVIFAAGGFTVVVLALAGVLVVIG